MAVYRFRITFEEYDEVYRDIELKSTQTFEQFHSCIQSSINFDASKPASFYMSNDHWKKGQEITMDDIAAASDHKKLSMKEARMCDFIADPHQKIYYVFDQPSQWTFYIELIKILPDGDSSKKYPVCVKYFGDAPKQYLKTDALKNEAEAELLDDELLEDVLEDEVNDDDDNIEEEFSEEVDEDEYDNIEEESEEEPEND